MPVLIPAKDGIVDRNPDPNPLSSKQFPGFPFDSAQGGESFDVAQDHELVEWRVEPRVKTGMTKQQ